jgi:uncharacterized protein
LFSEAAVLITPRELELHRIVVSKTYDPGALDFHGEDFQQAGPLAVRVDAELVGTEIRIRGHLATRVRAHCDRCLADVEIPIERDFDLSYRPLQSIAREEEIEVPRDELGVGFYPPEGVLLADVLTEQVILSLPMKIVCRPDCLGLCPVCGADRNHNECCCSPPEMDSPFARLR